MISFSFKGKSSLHMSKVIYGLMIALSLISAVLDTVGAIHGVPPTLSAAVSGMGSLIASNNAKG